MPEKLDPYAKAFLRTCYDAGITAENATHMLLKQARQNLQQGLPIDNVSRTILVDTGRRILAGHPTTR